MRIKKTKREKTKDPVRKTSKAVIKTSLQKTSKKKRTKPAKSAVKTGSKKTIKKTRPKTGLKSTAPSKKRPAGKKEKKTALKAAGKKKIVKKLSSKPSEEERKTELRRSLIRRREEIVKEAKTEISKYIKGETRQLVDSALDDGDWSVIDLSEDINLRRLSTHRENLLNIDEALRKIDEGTYGRCEECGEEINAERLRLLPFAIYCVDCQEKREELEKLGSE